ncbi:MAG: hypothetical protein ACRDGQ_13915 [Candidatus Limnocylindrales bacterium]
MTFGSGGPIAGEAARRGLTADEVAAAGREDVRVEQAALNEEELKELEHAEYYAEPAVAAAPAAAPAGLWARIRAMFGEGR